MTEAEAFVKGEPPAMVTQQGQRFLEGGPTGQKRPWDDFVVNWEDNRIVVYTDGVCKRDGRRTHASGIGIYWGPDDPRNIAERCPGEQTNYRADLIAIVRVLETAPVNVWRLIIETDSRYSINCSGKWLQKWRNNGFFNSKGSPVINSRIIRYLSALLEERKKRNQQVCLRYVQPGSGDPGNDGAAAQADIGATLEPRSDLDWESLEDQASKTIDAVAIAVIMASRRSKTKTEAPDERPTKIPRISGSTTFPGSSTTTLEGSKSLSEPHVPGTTPRPSPPHTPPRPRSKVINSKKNYQNPQRPPATINPNSSAVPATPPLPVATRPNQTTSTELATPADTADLHKQLSSPSDSASHPTYTKLGTSGTLGYLEIASQSFESSSTTGSSFPK